MEANATLRFGHPPIYGGWHDFRRTLVRKCVEAEWIRFWSARWSDTRVSSLRPKSMTAQLRGKFAKRLVLVGKQLLPNVLPSGLRTS
jgi:hypothetical protein